MNIITTDFSFATGSYDIFLSGCNAQPKCENCHNPESWDFSAGTRWGAFKDKIVRDFYDFNNVISRIFIMGGEPLDNNRGELISLVQTLKPYKKEIWLFTRYEWEDIPDSIKKHFDYIKCGRYIPSLSTKKNIQYGVQLATSNQKVYKVDEYMER